MFCCGGIGKKKHQIEAFNKINSEDKKAFVLNAQKRELDPNLIQRICSNTKVGDCPAPNTRN